MAFRALLRGLILTLCLISSAHAVVPELRQPAWAELSQEQKQILAPLSRDWDKLEAYRKKKWLGIAKRYPGMKPEEQARVQSQMKEWANLTPDQRKQAREQYKSLQKVPPEKKEALKQKWEEYQTLSEEEKKRLAEKAAQKPSPKPGVSKPAVVQKLPASIPQSLPTAAAPPEAAAAPAGSSAPAQAEVPAQAAPSPTPPVADTSAQTSPTASGGTPPAQQQ
jgi:hypothetical protein